MLKIEKVRPQGSYSKIDIKDIERDYLKRIKNDTSPYKILGALFNGSLVKINKIKKSLNNYSIAEQNYLQVLLNDFDNLILGSPQQLETFTNTYNSTVIGTLKAGAFGKGKKYVLNDFGKDLLSIFGYDDYFRKAKKKAIWFSKKINIKSCPYCNSQYTLVVDNKSSDSQAKFQFDHFFSKKKYPYLSVSMYNLIPSCANCNLAKSDKGFTLANHYHPYHSSLHDKAMFVAEYDVDIDKLTMGDTSKLQVKIKFTYIDIKDQVLVEEHDKVFNITGVYARMENDARILLRKYIVDKQGQSSIMAIKGLFPDDTVYDEYLLGNFPIHDDMLEKPLAKFTQDIAKDLKLI